VIVAPPAAFMAIVELPGVRAGAGQTRCITFVLRDANGQCAAPVSVPVNFAGSPAAGVAGFDPPVGAWTSVCAKDERHTLWDTQAVVAAENGQAAGAALTLVSGDFNNDGAINAIDLDGVLAEMGAIGLAGDCPWNGTPQADFSGDGAVLADDFSFVFINWERTSACGCAP
jgi:hypothetical protein